MTVIDALERLRSQWRAALPQKLAELDRALADARDARTHSERCDAVERSKRLAHRLRGTAGTYGFERVGVVAAEVEDRLERWQQAGGDLFPFDSIGDLAPEPVVGGSIEATIVVVADEADALGAALIAAGWTTLIVDDDDDLELHAAQGDVVLVSGPAASARVSRIQSRGVTLPRIVRIDDGQTPEAAIEQLFPSAR